MSPIVDAHQHFWQRSTAQLDYAWLESAGHEPICRDFLPQDLQPLITQARVDQTVLVQTQHHLAENEWALELAERNDFIAGVVGWVDLASDDCEEQLLEFLEHPKAVGIRHVTQDEPDEDFIVRDDVLRGLKVLEKHGCPFDLLFYVQHLRHAVELGRALPDLPMVIDHLAKPRIATGDLSKWKSDLAAAANCPNIYCKLSGMITEADWKSWNVTDLRPYAEVAMECFGPERLMFGSDWPVCLLAGSYQEVYDAASEMTRQLSSAEKSQIYGETARRFYQL